MYINNKALLFTANYLPENKMKIRQGHTDEEDPSKEAAKNKYKDFDFDAKRLSQLLDKMWV